MKRLVLFPALNVPSNFTCITSKSRPGASIDWFENGHNITNNANYVYSSDVTSSILTFTPNAENTRNLTCIANYLYKTTHIELRNTSILTIQCNVSRPCDSNVEWQYPQYNCLRADVINAVNQTYLLTGNVTSGEVINALSEVANVTEYKENRTSSELLNTTEISALTDALRLVAGLVSRQGIATYDVAKVFLKSASNILDMENKETWLSLKQENKNTSETLLSSIDEIGSGLRKRISAGVIGNVVVVNKNCVFEVRKLTDGIVQFPDNQTIQNDAQGDNTWIRQSKSRISLNTTALGEVVTIVIYKDMTGIISSRTSSNRSSHNAVIVNGPIISVSISDNSTKLVSPINMTFEHGQKNFTNATCNFWRFRPEQLGYWDNDGCKVQTSNDTITVCECYHLTNFAVLMSPFVEADEKSREIRIVSIVGISVSALCLLLTIIVFARLWRYVRSDRSILLLNLITALIISYGIFIGGIDRTENKIVCTVVAAALHYIYSAVFCLMLAESIGILSDVILVFAQNSPLRKLLVFAWGVPVIIVGSTLSITKTNGYGDDHYCWLSLSRGLRWAFVGPALFVILFNSIILIILFKKMFALKAMGDKPIKDKIKTTLWSLCVLVPLMGISWNLGIFYVNESASFMQYVFAVCNGLQGVYIFICNCVLNEKVKDGFKREKIRRKNKSMTSSL
ncbi:adhesion G protein-coupled receptor B1-like isoform X2 [Dreissena polymorpha]|uniref:adhesion G protein-coupled receptor B1-like isoform X2 n=1 Tax=Dreissena polymorpha TaxID=45954 RepID=UPI002264AB9E|nr:adhesion G protein-coupled receptor B1-like isoform X2 [Dreissena polymorpha]